MTALGKQGLSQGWNMVFAGTHAKDGKKLYAGLGLNDVTEDELRDKLPAAYVNDTRRNPFGDPTTDRTKVDPKRAIRFTGLERMFIPSR